MGVDRYSGLPFVARFRWSVGKIMEKFYRSFAEKKIIAAKCENADTPLFHQGRYARSATREWGRKILLS